MATPRTDSPKPTRTFRGDTWLVGMPVGGGLRAASRYLLEDRLRVMSAALERVGGHGKPKAVRKLRVAGRRLEGALDLLGPVLHPKRADRLAVWARRVRRAAGPVRDVDCVRDQWSRADVPASLLAFLANRRARLMPDLLDVVERAGGERGRVAHHGGRLTGKGVRRQVASYRELALAHVARELRQWRERMPRRDAEAAELHAFRIAGKRLRYGLELAAPELPGAHSHAQPALVQLQDSLGAVQDLDAEGMRIAAWRTEQDQPLTPEEREAMATREGARQAQLRALVDRWHLAWPPSRLGATARVLEQVLVGDLPAVGPSGAGVLGAVGSGEPASGDLSGVPPAAAFDR